MTKDLYYKIMTKTEDENLQMFSKTVFNKNKNGKKILKLIFLTKYSKRCQIRRFYDIKSNRQRRFW